VLSEFLEKAVELGCYEIEVEYKDQHELITAFQGSFGIEIGSVISQEAAPLFDDIKDLKRKKSVTIRGTTYRVTVSTYESFGEWAHRIQLKELTGTGASKKKR
jgi:hypothetical protein